MATQLNNSGVLFPDGTTQTTGLLGVSNSTTTNTALGYQTLVTNTGGFNTACGYLALSSNTTGNYNTATGSNALYSNTTGNNNTATGTNALYSNTTGDYNTAIGTNALYSNTSGDSNTALGYASLYSNTTGNYTVAIGAFALYNNQTSDNAVAIGYQSQYSIAADDQNVSVGYQALTVQLPDASFYNYPPTGLAVGETYRITDSGTADWLTCGSTSNAVGTVFLAVSSAASGTGNAVLLSNANYNTAIGYQALWNNGNNYNTAIGYQALLNNRTGSDATAVGTYALTNNTNGYQNTAVGRNALATNTLGDQNTAVGWIALSKNEGNQNTAIGRQSMAWMTSGLNNTALGFNTMPYAEGPQNNTAIGASAMVANVTGSNNTAVGATSLAALGNIIAATAMVTGQTYVIGYTGNTNWTAVGAPSNIPGTKFVKNSVAATGNGNAVPYNQSPDNCVAVGVGALSACFGDNNVGVGYFSGADSWINITSQNNTVVIGNTNTAVAYVRVAWSFSSDARDKNVLGSCPHGLDFINNLKPVKFTRKTSRTDDTPSGIERYGFLAQDILALEGNDSVIIDKSNEDSLMFNDASLTPVIVNAIQEMYNKLTSEIDSLKAEIALLKGQ
jgi:hypothetical protein